MRISTWRPSLRRWLEKIIKVSSYDLRQPTEYGEWICHIPPLANIAVVEGISYKAMAVQDIYFTIRYRADSRYIDLPLNNVEGLLMSLQLKALGEWEDIATLSDLRVLNVNDPVRVSEYGDGMADWLVTMVLSLELNWIPELEPELGTPELPTITRIDTGLYTEHLAPLPPLLDLPDSHLDPRNRDKYGQMSTDITSEAG